LDNELRLLVSEDGADAQRIETITAYLQRELDQLDVEQVSRLSLGDAPSGTRAFDVLAVGGLLVSLEKSTEALNGIIAAIRNWLSRSPGPARTVRLELGGDVLELSQASAAEQQRLIELFVSRHSAAGGAG
jgi:hypothetical protein